MISSIKNVYRKTKTALYQAVFVFWIITHILIEFSIGGAQPLEGCHFWVRGFTKSRNQLYGKTNILLGKTLFIHIKILVLIIII